jgi:hypothetical protein
MDVDTERPSETVYRFFKLGMQQEQMTLLTEGETELKVRPVPSMVGEVKLVTKEEDLWSVSPLSRCILSLLAQGFVRPGQANRCLHSKPPGPVHASGQASRHAVLCVACVRSRLHHRPHSR